VNHCNSLIPPYMRTQVLHFEKLNVELLIKIVSVIKFLLHSVRPNIQL